MIQKVGIMLYDKARDHPRCHLCCDGDREMMNTLLPCCATSTVSCRSVNGHNASSTLIASCHLNRDNALRIALTAIATLLIVQYSFSVAMTTKYRRKYNNISTGVTHDDNSRGSFFSWFLFKQPSTTMAPLPQCPELPSGLEGINVSDANIPVFFEKPTWDELELDHTELLEGGEYIPPNCTALESIALIIPFRDRDDHLRIFLNHIHPFLQRQNVRYTIYIIEQNPPEMFNRAMLMNIGYLESLQIATYDCFFFHDVDLLPENDFNLYRCPAHPRHMSAAVDSLMYRLPYPTIFGGVSAMTREQFKQVNGFSNMFFGWGGEDDDMYNRIHNHGLRIQRYPMHVARYRMIRHLQENPSKDRFKNLYTGAQRFDTDGLNSMIYNVTNVQKLKLYTLIQVTINQSQVVYNHEKKRIDIRLADLKERHRPTKNTPSRTYNTSKIENIDDLNWLEESMEDSGSDMDVSTESHNRKINGIPSTPETSNSKTVLKRNSNNYLRYKPVFETSSVGPNTPVTNRQSQREIRSQSDINGARTQRAKHKYGRTAYEHDRTNKNLKSINGAKEWRRKKQISNSNS